MLDFTNACEELNNYSGSCLNPTLDDDDIDNLSQSEIKNLAINVYSCLKENGKRINYMKYIKDMKNKECNNALFWMFNKIINDFIDNIDSISNKRKNFYKEIINIRYNILKNVYNELNA